MKAFEVKYKGQVFDYRLGKNLNLDKVKEFFEQKAYIVKNIWQEKRHVVGILEKDNKECFLKLAPTTGVSATTHIDFNWNDQLNKYLTESSIFAVPKNLDSGYYKEKLFYIIEEFFKGDLLAKRPTPEFKDGKHKKRIDEIIEISEIIQNLKLEPLSERDNEEYSDWFLKKVRSWHNEIPIDKQKIYNTEELLNIVENGYKKLDKKSRHGDFTPWHMIDLQNGKIGLIDGEHAMNNSVEYYDIAYLIQRVYSPLSDEQFANEIYQKLKTRNYNLEKLKIVLASRAIGGFCDEALIADNPNFERANKFKYWVLNS